MSTEQAIESQPKEMESYFLFHLTAPVHEHDGIHLASVNPHIEPAMQYVHRTCIDGMYSVFQQGREIPARWDVTEGRS
jgi:hypothetical protein